jgi:hypothetical protein
MVKKKELRFNQEKWLSRGKRWIVFGEVPGRALSEILLLTAVGRVLIRRMMKKSRLSCGNDHIHVTASWILLVYRAMRARSVTDF